MAAGASTTSQVVRFGVFELDVQALELRRNGSKVKLEGQPLVILRLLLERPGQVVAREELKEKLWPADTYVDFEHSINVAIKRLREALQDSATTPRYIETLPRRGYRFIYPIQPPNGDVAADVPAGKPDTRRSVLWAAAVVCLLVLVAAAAIAFNGGGMRDRLLNRPSTGSIRRIAVLPLRAQSADPNDEYLAQGFTEMFITELGALGTPEVLSHQTVLQYARSDKPVPVIGRELKVDAIIEGTVLRLQDRVRITINVVQVDPERHLFAEAFERNMQDVFTVQRDVPRAIAEKIRTRVPDSQLHRPPPRPVSPEVADAMARGFAYFKKGTEQDRDKAGEWFRKAVEADPDCALGYAYLAVLYAHGGAVRQGGAGENRAVTRLWAEKALQLDEGIAEAHAALGWVELFSWNFQAADREFKRAIELNPSFMPARTWYAQYLATVGRKEEAIAQANVIWRLDPVSPSNVVHAAWAMMVIGRVDEAVEQFRAVEDLNPEYPWAHLFLAEAYMRKNMDQEAVSELQQAVRLTQPDPRALGALAFAYSRTGQRDEAQKIVRELEARLKDSAGQGRHLPINVMVPAYLAVGEKDKALSYLEEGYARHGSGLPFITSEEYFRPLFTEPRFQDVVRKVGIPAVH